MANQSLNDFFNNLDQVHGKMKEVNKESQTISKRIGGIITGPMIEGLSRFDNSVGETLFKFRGLVDTFTSLKNRAVGTFKWLTGGQKKLTKEQKEALGGYKNVNEMMEVMNKKLHAGELLAGDFGDRMKQLQDLGLVDEKGKPKKGGMMRGVKSFIFNGLRLFKKLLWWGSLAVLGFALLFPVIQKLWPKIKELAPTIKENFLKVLEIFKPVWEAIKTFIGILFDPNATWLEKVGAYINVFVELGKSLFSLALKAFMKFVENIPNMIRGIWNYIVWPIIKGFLMGIWELFPESWQNAIISVYDFVVGVRENLNNALEKYLGIKEAVRLAKGAIEGDEEAQDIAAAKGIMKMWELFGKGKSLVGLASGGPVMAGRPYMVGERGPELFMPRSSGTIIPNGAGSSIHVHVNGRVGASDHELRDIARRVGQMINKEVNRTTSAGVRL